MWGWAGKSGGCWSKKPEKFLCCRALVSTASTRVPGRQTGRQRWSPRRPESRQHAHGEAPSAGRLSRPPAPSDPPQTEPTPLRETPSAWAPWHPVAQALCFRRRGRRFNPSWGRSHRPHGMAKKVKKKKRIRNVCCLHTLHRARVSLLPAPGTWGGGLWEPTRCGLAPRGSIRLSSH